MWVDTGWMISKQWFLLRTHINFCEVVYMLNRKLKTGDQMRAIQLEKDSGIEYYVRNTKEGYMHRTSEAIQGQYFI